jgi:hypothetical protein
MSSAPGLKKWEVFSAAWRTCPVAAPLGSPFIGYQRAAMSFF